MKPLNKIPLKLSDTVALHSQVKVLIQEGKDIISLLAGEPTEQVPSSLLKSVTQAIQNGKIKYDNPSGLRTLKQAVIEQLYHKQNITYSPDEIVISSGVKQALYNTLRVLLNPYDEVLIPVPYWVTYPQLVTLNQATPVLIPTSFEQNYKVNVDNLKSFVTPHTKALILNSPNNPSGAVYSQKELKSIAQFVESHNLYLIYDEIYNSICYDNNQCESPVNVYPAIKNQTVILNGFSKSHAMTGWRVGYSASSKEISQRIAAFQSQSTHHPSIVSQYGALAAVSENDFVSQMVKNLTLKRELVHQYLQKLPLVKYHLPQGAFYFLIDTSQVLSQSNYTNNNDLCQDLLQKHHLAIMPGSAFGVPKTVRITFTATRLELEKGLQIFSDFIKTLIQ